MAVETPDTDIATRDSSLPFKSGLVNKEFKATVKMALPDAGK